MEKLIYVSLMMMWAALIKCQREDFLAFKQKMEGKIALLADGMSSVYGERCSDGVVQCKVKSYNLCQGTSERKCFDDFPRPLECTTEGAYLSRETTIRFPTGNVDTNTLTNEERQFVCTSALLDPYMKEFNDRQFQYGIGYIGNQLGFLRSYPSVYQGCTDYDPRFRPWYVGATSGSKNLVILMDISGSMDGGRLDIAKIAIKSIIDTFSNNDFVAIVPFNNKAQPLVSNKLTRATLEFKQNLTYAIDEIDAEGETNYTKAFQKAFTLINQADADEYGSPCTNSKSVIMFMTDGVPTEGDYKNSTEIINFIHSQIAAKSIGDIILFTYAMQVVDPIVLLEMSCEFNGIMFELDVAMEETEIVQIMRSYYGYIARGLNITRPIWTEPYEDEFGFGELVTVSLPVYYTEGDVTEVIGVVGLDVVMKTFYDFGYTREETIQELVNSAPCLDNSLSECEVEAFRSDASKCGVFNCSASANLTQCASFPSYDIFHETEDWGEGRCCGLMIAELVIVIISGIIIIHIVAIIVYVCRKGDIDQWFNARFGRVAN